MGFRSQQGGIGPAKNAVGGGVGGRRGPPCPLPAAAPPLARGCHYRGADCSPSSSGDAGTAGALPHLPHQHGAQLGVPRAQLPKTRGGEQGAKVGSGPPPALPRQTPRHLCQQTQTLEARLCYTHPHT